MKKTTTIVCPYCGAEYLPGEIYVPDAFIGQPDFVVRDEEGKIEDYAGTAMDTTEEYTCDKCNKHFKVVADVKFKVLTDEDLEKEYATSLKKESLFLAEE